jgi:hypothetical protein
MIKPKCLEGLGFRETEVFNLALLAKQSWRILQDGSSLSTCDLKAMFFPDQDLLQASLGASPSRVWRAILVVERS